MLLNIEELRSSSDLQLLTCADRRLPALPCNSPLSHEGVIAASLHYEMSNAEFLGFFSPDETVNNGNRVGAAVLEVEPHEY